MRRPIANGGRVENRGLLVGTNCNKIKTDKRLQTWNRDHTHTCDENTNGQWSKRWFVGDGFKKQNTINKTTTRNIRSHHSHPTFNSDQLITQIYFSSSLKPYCHFTSAWFQLRSSSKHQYHTLQKRPVTASLGKSYFHHGLKDCGKIPAPLPTCDRRPLLNRRSGDGNGWMVRLFSSKPPPLRQASPTEGFLQEISLHLIWHRSIRILYQYIYYIYHCIYAPDMPKA